MNLPKPTHFDESWLSPGGYIPVNIQTTAALANECQRLRAELVELRPYAETLNRRLTETVDEMKRLRAENERLRKLIDDIGEDCWSEISDSIRRRMEEAQANEEGK